MIYSNNYSSLPDYLFLLSLTSVIVILLPLEAVVTESLLLIFFFSL